MNDEDETLRAALRPAQHQADGGAPKFEATFRAAEHRLHDRRKMQLMGLAAAMAVAILALSLLPTHRDEIAYVDIEELTATTRWSAPSDSLFPRHQIDVYRDVPQLFEWTNISTAASFDFDEGA